MLKIAICDDNTAVCSEVEKMVLEYTEKNAIQIEVEVFYTGESLIHHIETMNKFDLIFLDIEMGNMTGIGVGQVIRNEFRDHISKIIFISGAEGYEMDLFNLQPLNFLKKPIQKNKVFACMDLAWEIVGVMNSNFEYKSNYEIKNIQYSEIVYFESFLKKIRIVTMNAEEDEFYGSLQKIKEKLPKIFVSPHKSYVINFTNVKSMRKEELIMSNGDKIPISQRNIKIIRDLQLELEKEKRDARL